MSESTERALEHMVAGILFCTAIMMLLWLHSAFLKQIQQAGRQPERLILVEQNEEMDWRHSDE